MLDNTQDPILYRLAFPCRHLLVTSNDPDYSNGSVQACLQISNLLKAQLFLDLQIIDKVSGHFS